MTKRSVEILGLPVISITEGRELGMSKTLLIDAKNGQVAAITIEDEDWYRGVKLLPYSSVIAIGHDAVTITNSENILTLEDASDYEAMLDANIRIIGTKAITKSGTINGKAFSESAVVWYESINETKALLVVHSFTLGTTISYVVTIVQDYSGPYASEVGAPNFPAG